MQHHHPRHTPRADLNRPDAGVPGPLCRRSRHRARPVCAEGCGISDRAGSDEAAVRRQHPVPHGAGSRQNGPETRRRDWVACVLGDRREVEGPVRHHLFPRGRERSSPRVPWVYTPPLAFGFRSLGLPGGFASRSHWFPAGCQGGKRAPAQALQPRLDGPRHWAGSEVRGDTPL